MSAPIESVAFCTIFNEVDFLRVSEAYTEDTVILSSKRKIFDVYKISDQKCVKSWSVRHGVTLSSPVLWNTYLEKFITVTNTQDVRIWGKDNTDFEKAKKKQSSTKVHEVLSVDGYEPIILFSNGNVDYLNTIKEDHSNGPLIDNQKICWCKAVKQDATVTVTFTALSEAGVNLHTQRYDTDNTNWHHTVTEVPRPDNSDLCSCDASVLPDAVKVFYLWTNGSLSTITVSNGSCSTGTTRKLSGITSNSSILALDDIHIAIAGIKDDRKNGIGIYDTKFGLVKSWYPFPDKCLAKPKMFKVQDHLFLPCGTTLYRYKYECEPSTLISLLGQASMKDKAEEVPNHYIWKPTDKKSNISQQSAEVGELLSQTVDQSSDYKTFKGKFSELLLALSKIENRHWLTTSHMTTLLQRIMGEKKFWARDELCQLIELNCIPLSKMDDLFSCLEQRSEISILHKILQTLPNIPEKCLCRAVSFFLNCDEEKLPVQDEMEDQSGEDDSEGSPSNYESEDIPNNNSEEKTCTCPLSSNRAAIVNDILGLPYSDTFLLECLRKIAFKDALKLLEYLCYLLEAKAGFQKDVMKGANQKLSQVQVVDWLCLVLDAHITQFVLSPDSHMTIVKLESIVNEQVQFFDGLVTLAALLEHFKEKSALPQERKIGHYCIEVLHVY